MVLTRSPLLVMMSVRRRSCGDSVGRLGQQLRRMAHRADRVADLVRDARAQPAERGELRLLHALGDQRRVLQEDQRRSRCRCCRATRSAAAPGCRRRTASSVQRAELPVVGVPAPGIEQVQQARRDFAERRACLHGRAMQQQRGRLVDQADRVVRVDDQDALAQVLHDELVQLGEVRDVDFALADALFALAQAARQRPDAERDDEHSAPTMPAEAKSPASPRAASVVSVCCTSTRQRGDRGEHQRESLPHDEARRADRQHQQRCEAAVHAAARVGQQRDRESRRRTTLDERLHRHVRPAPLDASRSTAARKQEIRGRSRRRTAPDAPGRPRVGVTATNSTASSSGTSSRNRLTQREHSPGEVGRAMHVGVRRRQELRPRLAAERPAVMRCRAVARLCIGSRIPPEYAAFAGSSPGLRRSQRARSMNLHEYQSKQLFASYGIPVPTGYVGRERPRRRPQRRGASAARSGSSRRRCTPAAAARPAA